MSPIELTLPLPPNIGNARMHWRTKLKAKKQYWGTLNLLGGANLLGKAQNWTRATISAHVVVGNRMDIDNLFARLKWSIDWMIAEGYVYNDDPRHLEWAGIPTQEVSRTKDPTVTFTISPIPE